MVLVVGLEILRKGLIASLVFSLFLAVFAASAAAEDSDMPPSVPTWLPSPVFSYAMNLLPGWNLVSVPIYYPSTTHTVGARVESVNCNVKSSYSLDPRSQKFLKGSIGKGVYLPAGIGYWIRIASNSSPCTITFSGDTHVTPDNYPYPPYRTTGYLYKGWNIIAAPFGGAALADIPTDCTILSTWEYDRSKDSPWTRNPATLREGFGYFVYVNRNCSFGNNPPAPAPTCIPCPVGKICPDVCITPTPTPTIPPVPNPCPSGWDYFHGHCYAVSQDKLMNQSLAEAYCRGMNAHLATINNAYENNWVRAKYYSVLRDHELWIGYQAPNGDGNWSWISGEAASYTNWLPGNPDGPLVERCATMFNSSGQWNSASCSIFSNHTALCEKAIVPVTPPAPECYDSDGGRNYAVRGTVYADADNSCKAGCTDYCTVYGGISGYVVEYYCTADNNVGVDVSLCGSGVCSSGACVSPAVVGPPALESVSISQGPSNQRAINTIFSDPSGVGDIERVYLGFSDCLESPGEAYASNFERKFSDFFGAMLYNPSSAAVSGGFATNDTGAACTGGQNGFYPWTHFPYNSSMTAHPTRDLPVSNAHGTVTLTGISKKVEANGKLNVTWNLNLSNFPSGMYPIYYMAKDKGGLWQTFSSTASWTKTSWTFHSVPSPTSAPSPTPNPCNACTPKVNCPDYCDVVYYVGPSPGSGFFAGGQAYNPWAYWR